MGRTNSDVDVAQRSELGCQFSRSLDVSRPKHAQMDWTHDRLEGKGARSTGRHGPTSPVGIKFNAGDHAADPDHHSGPDLPGYPDVDVADRVWSPPSLPVRCHPRNVGCHFDGEYASGACTGGKPSAFTFRIGLRW